MDRNANDRARPYFHDPRQLELFPFLFNPFRDRIWRLANAETLELRRILAHPLESKLGAEKQ